jgi:hypothetical protein
MTHDGGCKCGCQTSSETPPEPTFTGKTEGGDIPARGEKSLKGPTAAEKMLGMNWEALHDKVELYGLAGLCGQFMSRGLTGDRLTKAVVDTLDAAREVKAKLDGLK